MSQFKRFDTSNLTFEEQSILDEFHKRREVFNNYLTVNQINYHTCPGCGFPILSERGAYEICDLCDWEDDYQDDPDADEIWGGPNYELSLTENRLIFGKLLKKMIYETGGEENRNPQEVLTIISEHIHIKSNLLENLPDDADLDHPNLVNYQKTRIELLKKLVAK